MAWRHQLPAFSPVEIRAALRLLGKNPRSRLRALLRSRYRREGAILLGSGTQALTRAFRVVPRRHGHRPLIALPAYSCFDLASAALGADARVRFYDLDPSTLGPHPGSLRATTRAGVDAVVVAPLYGIPVDWDALLDALGPERPVIIEDAAQGFGARWKGEPVGSAGDLAVLSFGRGKGWTGGGGGALLSDRSGSLPGEPPWRDRTRPDTETPNLEPVSGALPASGSSEVSVGNRLRLRDVGVLVATTAQWLLGRPGLYGLPARLPFFSLGETTYHPPREPEPMATLSAALVVATADRAEREAACRIATARALLRRIGDLLGSRWGDDFRSFDIAPDARPGYLRLPLLTPSGVAGFPDPEKAGRAGIMPGYPRPLPTLSPLAGRIVGAHEMPGARALTERLVTLPTHTLLRPRDVDRVVELIAGYARNSAPGRSRSSPGELSS